MNFKMEFYHKKEEEVLGILRKRYLDDVPDDGDLPIQFQTPILIRYPDYNDPSRKGFINHNAKLKLFREEPFLILNIDLSLKPLNFLYSIVLSILLLFSYFVLGHWAWILVFALSFLVSYWYSLLWMSSRFERYCEKLKQEILQA